MVTCLRMLLMVSAPNSPPSARPMVSPSTADASHEQVCRPPRPPPMMAGAGTGSARRCVNRRGSTGTGSTGAVSAGAGSTGAGAASYLAIRGFQVVE